MAGAQAGLVVLNQAIETGTKGWCSVEWKIANWIPRGVFLYGSLTRVTQLLSGISFPYKYRIPI